MIDDRKQKLWREFGRYIKTAREGLNLSQEGAAHKVEMTRQQWNRLENGISGTKRETVIKIAQKLGLDETEALNKAGYDSPKSLPTLPDGLDLMDFDGLDRDDIRDIRDYINFKKSQKKRPAPLKFREDDIDHDVSDGIAFSLIEYQDPDEKRN